MFWENYLSLCKQEKKTPSGLAKELGITSGTVTGWKKGKIPSEAKLQILADHFGVDKWKLLGEKNTATVSDGNPAVAEMNSYAMSIFRQLNFENQIRAANELQSLLQKQQAQDGLK